MKKIQSEQLSSRKNQSEPSNSDLMDTIQENYQQIFNARYIDPAIEKSTTGIIITREQFPLTYGWAFSIHKSQGLTINKAIIDVENCFDIGQAYVALSRVQTYNGLFLEKEVHAKEIKVSNEVKVFYRNLLKNK
jgi:ATP-dependent exoDNAse (exonuclease V) alpha subunit